MERIKAILITTGGRDAARHESGCHVRLLNDPSIVPYSIAEKIGEP